MSRFIKSFESNKKKWKKTIIIKENNDDIMNDDIEKFLREKQFIDVKIKLISADCMMNFIKSILMKKVNRKSIVKAMLINAKIDDKNN